MARELPRLPQARRYLRSARWGFEDLLAKKIVDTPFIFYLIDILASLRAVQHALMNYDRTLSKEHERLIDEWKKNTAPETSPELDFHQNVAQSHSKRRRSRCPRDLFGISAIGEDRTGRSPARTTN